MLGGKILEGYDLVAIIQRIDSKSVKKLEQDFLKLCVELELFQQL